MREITKDEMRNLVERGICKNTRKGFVNQEGKLISFYKTKNKCYIQDRYADMVQSPCNTK